MSGKKRPDCRNWLHGLLGWREKRCPFECDDPDYYKALDAFCAARGITLPTHEPTCEEQEPPP